VSDDVLQELKLAAPPPAEKSKKKEKVRMQKYFAKSS
jgi:hypothetical protein